jgi:HSP20 family protein
MTLVKFNRPVVRNNSPIMRNLFNEFFEGLPYQDFNLQSNAKSALVNISEDEKSYDLTFSVPGFKKEEFKIEIEDQMLVVSGEHQENKESNDKNYTRKEFSFQNFKRSFTLPENADTDHIEARFENGILHVSLHKKVEEKREAKKIEVQ